MSKPGFLTVRDRRTGQPISIPISSIPREIHPSKWCENAYWMWSPARPILEPLIKKYLDHRLLTSDEVRILADYMVDYACHIAVMGYLFGGGESTLEYNLECIRKLREIQPRAHTRPDLNEMINVGMDYALDCL